MSEPCSIERTPARTARLIPSAPCAWAATKVPYSRGLLDRRVDLFLGELRDARLGAPGEHGAGRDNLDEVGAPIEQRPHPLAHLVDRVGDPEAEGRRQGHVRRRDRPARRRRSRP